MKTSCTYTLFCKKPGSCHSTKSFLISYEILSILALEKVPFLVSYFLNVEFITVVACFLTGM